MLIGTCFHGVRTHILSFSPEMILTVAVHRARPAAVNVIIGTAVSLITE